MYIRGGCKSGVDGKMRWDWGEWEDERRGEGDGERGDTVKEYTDIQTRYACRNRRGQGREKNENVSYDGVRSISKITLLVHNTLP